MLASQQPTDRPANQYAELKGLVKQAGLLDTQPAYYTGKIGATLALLVVSVIPLVIHISLWLQLADAALLAVAFTQIAFLFHDICHRALARDGRRNAIFGLLFGNLLIGLSRAWWTDNHNAHHSHPNEVGLDPNIDIPILAFTEAQADRTRGVARFIVAHQQYFLFPIFCLQGFNALVQSAVFLRRNPTTRLARLESGLIVLHHLLYIGLIVLALGLWGGLLFILLHQVFIGLYSGSVFAPNHKGMPVLEDGVRLGFLEQQVLTARNVKAHWATDFVYGGLNYQIEHHLFPTMPRNNQRLGQVIIKDFCATHGIAYHEAGILASYREILQHLSTVGATVRIASR